MVLHAQVAGTVSRALPEGRLCPELLGSSLWCLVRGPGMCGWHKAWLFLRYKNGEGEPYHQHSPLLSCLPSRIAFLFVVSISSLQNTFLVFLVQYFTQKWEPTGANCFKPTMKGRLWRNTSYLHGQLLILHLSHIWHTYYVR
jgi:hypothetical protein